MCICFDYSCWTSCDTLQLIITIILAILPYLILFYILRPKLDVVSAHINESGKSIKIKVVNTGRFDAVNIRIEACAIDTVNKYTYHFKIDHYDFLILPKKSKITDNEKSFKTISILESTNHNENNESLISKLKLGEYKLRVRIHSYNSLSGLGKAEEKIIRL